MRKAVLQILERHLPQPGMALESAILADPVQKFKILSEIMQATGRQISNVELHNTQSFADALKLAEQPEQNVLRDRKLTILDRLQTMQLPPNMHWVPSKRDLIAAIQAQSSSSDTVLELEEDV